jgi:hypothetical protein
MTENVKILEKIKKCLALAGSSNPHEAETAWRQARKLMESHKLEMLDVQASEVNTTSSYAGKRPPFWLLSLAQACAKAFSCSLITRSSIHDSQVVFIGTGNASEFCEYAFTVLQTQLKFARTGYVATLSRCKLATKRRRGEIFAENWVGAVYSTVAKFAQVDPETTALIEAYFQKNLSEISTYKLEPKKVSNKDRSAAYAGYEAGQSAKLHRAMGQDQRMGIAHA